MKEARAVGNYIRLAPRKARLVVDLIRGLTVNEALGVLGLCRKRAAQSVGKVLKSAMANAVAASLFPTPAIPVNRSACGMFPFSMILTNSLTGLAWSTMDSNPGTNLIINPFFQLFSRLEKRELFRFDENLFPCFRIPTHITLIIFYKKTA